MQKNVRNGEANKAYHPASSYIFWQGLKGVPAALTLIIAASALQPWWPFEKLVTIAVVVGALYGASLLNKRISAYYIKQFGEHQQDRRQKIIEWLSFYPGAVAAILIDVFLTPPVALTPIYVGFSFAVFWHRSGRRLWHYLFNTAVLFATATLPLLGILENGMDALGVFLIVLGALYLIGGLLEHQDLQRHFPTNQDTQNS